MTATASSQIANKFLRQRKEIVKQWLWTRLANRLGALDAMSYEDYSMYLEDYKRRHRLADEGAEYILLRKETSAEDWDKAFQAYMRYIG